MTIINNPYIEFSEEEAQTIQDFMNIMEEIIRHGTDSMSDWASHLYDEMSDFFSEYEA